MNKFLLSILISIWSLSLVSQVEDGIVFNSPEALNGYTLFSNFDETFLIDNCGRIVNKWEELRFPINHVKLMPNGNVVFIKNGQINLVDWNNNSVRSYSYDIPTVELDYEVIPMDKGNFLCIGREVLSSDEFRELGFNNSNRHRKIDVILEIDPNTQKVVWFWNSKDHIIQERDSSVANYGLVRDHPHKLDIDALATWDWSVETFMINGFDYNEELDLIALSLRKMGEVVIIDHSTTTEEAASSEGGRYGKGGDILFRWGNPQNYKRGTSADQELYFQHNPNWIQYGEHKGKLIMYNNGLSARTYSSVEIIDPAVDSNGDFILQSNQPFKLNETPISINEVTTGTSFFSEYTSSAKVLENENILITSGGSSQILEVNLDGDILWEYKIPRGGVIFRTIKYPLDYPAFEGKDLTPGGTVEDPESSYACELFNIVSSENLGSQKLKFLINQNSNKLIIKSHDEIDFEVYIYNVSGQIVYSNSDDYFYSIDKSNLNLGQYFVKVISENKTETESIFIH